MHPFEKIDELVGLIISSPIEERRRIVSFYLAKLSKEEQDMIIKALQRQIKKDACLLGAKRAILTIATTPDKTFVFPKFKFN